MRSPLARSAALLALAAAIAALAACQRTMAPTPTIIARAEDPYANVHPDRRTTSVNMLFVTDRAPEPKPNRPVWYGYRRSPSPAFGVAEVRLGKNLTWDELTEATSSEKRRKPIPMSIGTVTELGRLPSNIPALQEIGGQLRESDEVIAERQRLADQFVQEIARRLQDTKRKDIYLFVHGYHNTFDASLYALSQMWHFAGREGVPIVYSWPAGAPGLLRGYTHDRESGEYTVFHLKGLISLLATVPGLENLHLIGHSRGTDVLTTALRELHIAHTAAGRRTKDALKLQSLMLAAPDLDGEVASQRIVAERLYEAADQFTVYVSPGDDAIGTADWLFSSSQRLGRLRYEDLAPQTKESLAAIRDVNVINVVLPTSGHGHSYFYDHPQVASDVLLMLRDGLPPGAEHGRPLINKAPGWWELDRDYLMAEPGEPMRAAQPIERTWPY